MSSVVTKYHPIAHSAMAMWCCLSSRARDIDQLRISHPAAPLELIHTRLSILPSSCTQFSLRCSTNVSCHLLSTTSWIPRTMYYTFLSFPTAWCGTCQLAPLPSHSFQLYSSFLFVSRQFHTREFGGDWARAAGQCSSFFNESIGEAFTCVSLPVVGNHL